MAPSIWQIMIVVILLVLLFGRGKISSLMGDVAKGIKSFKKGMSEDVDDTASTTQGDGKVEDKSDEAGAADRTIDVTPEPRKDNA